MTSSMEEEQNVPMVVELYALDPLEFLAQAMAVKMTFDHCYHYKSIQAEVTLQIGLTELSS